jgi:predicted Zn finger-like uncharacterized protein
MNETPMPAAPADALCTVACPQCGAGYQVPKAKLAEKPRKLKCAQCAHVWVASLPEEPADAPQPEAQPVPQPESTQPAPEATPEPTPETVPEATTEPTPSVPEEPMYSSPLAVGDVLKPSWQAYLVGDLKWLTLAFVLVVVGLGAAVFSLLQTLPHTAPVQEAEEPAPTRARALKPVKAPQGVVMHQVEAQAYQIEQGTVLQLQGRIANTAQQLTVLPQLQAELLDDGGVVQDFWPVTLVTTTLPAQSEIPFTVSFTNPLGQAWRLIWVN